MVAAAAAGLLLAGCGGHPGTSARQTGAGGPAGGGGAGAGAGTRASTASPHAATARALPSTAAAPVPVCQTTSLSVGLAAAKAGGAAGTSYVPLTFGNKSAGQCELRGYPGVSFVTAAGGSQIGAAATRDPGFTVMPVMLPAGGTAHAWLQVAAAQNYPGPACGQVTAPELRVYPPGNTVPAYLRNSFPACRSASAGVLSVLPVRPGPGQRGAMP
jgi:hypothetical protein